MPAASARQQDPNGFLLVKGCPISSYGVFEYSAAQVGIKDGDPDRVVKVYRPEEAVRDPSLIQSLQNVPLINDHEMLSGFMDDDSASAPEEYGIDGVLFDVAYNPPWLSGNVKVFTRKMQSDLQQGKKDLSLGYTCDFQMSPGTFNGQAYDVVQTNMRGNHIALVDAGRVPGARILDGRSTGVLCYDHLDLQPPTRKGSQMAKRKAMDGDAVAQLRAQLKALLPAFEQFLNEEAAEPVPSVAPAPAVAAPVDETAVIGSASPTAPAVAPAATPAAVTGDLPTLIQQLEAVLTQLKNSMGGDPVEGTDPDDPDNEVSDPDDEPNDGSNDMPKETKQPEGDALEGLVEDPAEKGLNIDPGAQTDPGKASPGPKAGENTEKPTGDAALRAVYADTAAKTKLYDRLSKVVGAFDGAMDLATATAADVAVYGVKKLKLTVPKGQEFLALDNYLTGVETARRAAPAIAQRAADAASVPAIDAYFKE